MPMFSVIIPVYNAEKTLNRCLDSVMNQTFSAFEVLMIDDGSTDSSYQICQEYSTKDERFITYHQENKGPSSARNFGLDRAKGEWICFVDSDDMISQHYFEKVHKKQNSNITDAVYIGYKKINSYLEESITIDEYNGVIDDLILNQLVDNHLFGYTWSKLFRKNVIDSNRFDESLCLFEDEVFACSVLKNCNYIQVIEEALYYYCVGDLNSLSGKTYQDYCKRCDKLYLSWRDFATSKLSDNAQFILKKKSNQLVNQCMYYGLERNVDFNLFIKSLSECAFFKEHNSWSKFDKCVEKRNYVRLNVERVKYRLKVNLSKWLRRKTK